MTTRYGIAWCVVALAVLASPGASEAAGATLQDAIQARAEVAVLKEDAGDLAVDVRRPMRRVIAKAEAQQTAGNILLMKEDYAEAIRAYRAAAALYRRALDGRRILRRLAKARKLAARARMLAEASTPTEKLQAARRLELSADAHERAGEFQLATAGLDKAAKAYESLLPPGKAATLEEAVAARTAMLSARKRIRDLSTFEAFGQWPPGSGAKPPPAPRPESLPDLVGRALQAEAAAAEALEEREYTPARALFARAETLYARAPALQAARDKVVAARKAAQDSMALAGEAFRTEARPASFERGRQRLQDGDEALAGEELDKAKQLFSDAAGHFARSRTEAVLAADFAKARDAWSAAVSGTDEALLARHAADEWAAAKDRAADARRQVREGEVQLAAVTLKKATVALRRAGAKAVAAENARKAAPILRRLQGAIQRKDKFAAEDILAELAKAVPGYPRLTTLRDNVAALPGPEKKRSLDLGGGVKMQLVLIRPGRFTMGSPPTEPQRESDEGPQREVTISKPFYMGVYEVTQEQYRTVTGKSPSRFQGPKNPVERVSWEEATAFCKALSEKTGPSTGLRAGAPVRLPTEAEWEYACRAGTTTPFHTGETIGTDQANYDGAYAYGGGSEGVYREKTIAVGGFKPNPWGLYDMHGNVGEWCRDRYAAKHYAKGKKVDPAGPASGTAHVLRGGAWDTDPRYCRSAVRLLYDPVIRLKHCSGGLRVVVEVDRADRPAATPAKP